ncbi:MAG: hypothetical protein AAGA09_01285 [Pseudomonadota bacterium]
MRVLSKKGFFVSAMQRARIATPFVVCLLLSACASTAGEQWSANGYLTPGPTSEPEIIGVFDNRPDCKKAASDWASRQVVGNPVFTECLPVDRI